MGKKELVLVSIVSTACILFIVGHFILKRNIISFSVNFELQNARTITTENGQVNISNQTIKITWFRKPQWLPSSFNFSQCDFTNCALSYNSSDMDKSHAVIFHNRFLSKVVPKKRNGQIWIIWTLESPANDGDLTEKWRKEMDWSATYRTDSDIYVQRMLKLRDKPIVRNYSEIFRKKTKLVSWAVSNCKTPSKRRKYVEELKKYIDIDIYGRCGENNDFCKKKTNMECHAHLSSDYKFYLGFENSLCKDYLTEKVFNNFLDNNNMIYVARGAPNLHEFIPKNTVIYTSNFRSPKHLAQFLIKLGSNETEYTSYLRETDKYYLFGNFKDRAYCKICELLNTYKERKYSGNGRNFNAWYRKDTCKTPTDI